MKIAYLASAASFILMTPAYAADPTADAQGAPDAIHQTASAPAAEKSGGQPTATKKVVFSTGVAKGRDLLDSAISTSAMDEERIQEIGARTLGELLRTVPGIRVEDGGDGEYTNYTVRGLPLAGTGSKWLQFQEDGLPILEFGDIGSHSADMYIRPDLSLARIESIRGGSASTFASNSPGGVINFISKTGEEEGGAIQLSTGLGDYSSRRADFEYGGKLSSNLRFSIGGFYRSGDGARDPGTNSFRGGQVKLNVTREFANGYVRLYAKMMDDRQPYYASGPLHVTGTNSDPSYNTVAGFDPRHHSVISKYMINAVGLDVDGTPFRSDLSQSWRAKSQALGLEARFDIASWTFVNRMRYSTTDSELSGAMPSFLANAGALATIFGGPGAQFSYATGPKTGQVIAAPNGLNGNGLAALSVLVDARTPNMDYFVNDFRASRVWKIGGGDLTVTAGLYKSLQNVTTQLTLASVYQDFADETAALLDLRTAAGTKLTQGGIAAYSVYPSTSGANRYANVDYDLTAPYGSFNFHKGGLSIGGSLRYDSGKVSGQRYSAELGGGRTRWRAIDMNGDGVISPAEVHTGFFQTDIPGPVDYDYDYVSYSAGINYRVSRTFAAFARYSRGARVLADTILFTPLIDATTGKLQDSKSAYNPVRQAEVGVKYRTDAVALNLTGFVANTAEHNYQVVTGADGLLTVQPFSRSYRAYGAEFEGSYQHGPFSLTAAATYTHAEIKSDSTDATIAGNAPRHQPKLILQAMPAVDLGRVSFGSSVVHTGSSYAQDNNKLKMPAYTTVNAFVQFRPIDRVQLSLNGSNLFNTLGLVDVTQGTLPADGIVNARVINGRTVSASMRFDF